jgi:hypothetical protein
VESAETTCTREELQPYGPAVHWSGPNHKGLRPFVLVDPDRMLLAEGGVAILSNEDHSKAVAVNVADQRTVPELLAASRFATRVYRRRVPSARQRAVWLRELTDRPVFVGT